MVWKVQSWMPLASLPMNDGWKRTSGHRKRSLPMTMTLPSGSSYDFSSEEEEAAVEEAEVVAMAHAEPEAVEAEVARL